MPIRRVASLNQPDEHVEFNGVVESLVTLGDVTVGRAVQAPGWRWSRDWAPTVGGEWCEAHHVGFMLSGRQGVLLRDGTTLEFGKDDVYDVPPGHDGYTIGDEPAVMIEWTGIRTWIAERGGLGDRVLTTLLFTDLVGSTALASDLGDTRWRDVIETHVATARNILERHHGLEVELTGDGILARFSAPAQAVRAAWGLARAADLEGLAIRAGVHVGEVEIAGEHVRGVAVHHAARVMALAGRGEVLVSESARLLLGSMRLRFEDRGTHVLKGLPGEHRVFAVHPDGGPSVTNEGPDPASGDT